MALETIMCKRTMRWGIALNGTRIPFFPMHHTEEQAEREYQKLYPTARIITTDDPEHHCHKAKEAA